MALHVDQVVAHLRWPLEHRKRTRTPEQRLTEFPGKARP